MGVRNGGGTYMSSFSVKLNPKRPCRYVFEANLWVSKLNKYGEGVRVLLDTGSFNTIIHKALAAQHGTMLKTTMLTSIGGYKGEANLCVLDKIKVGGCIFEKVVALAVPFEGELKDHILLGANVTNNWKFTVSRHENIMEATEQFSDEALKRNQPYRYCFDNKGRVMAFQDMDDTIA